MQCFVVGTFLRPLAQRLRMNGAEHGPSAGIHHGHYDLGPARGVEHDPVELRSVACHLDAFAGACWLHRHSVLTDVLVAADAALPRKDVGTDWLACRVSAKVKLSRSSAG